MDGKISYRRYALTVQDAGQYFLFSRYYIRIMGREEALFLQDLINQYNISLRYKQVRDDDFFPCSILSLWQSLLWAEKTQIKLMRSLIRRGYIERKMEGMPAVRFVRINIELVEKHLASAITYDLKLRCQPRPVGRDKASPTGRGIKEFLQNSKEEENPSGFQPEGPPPCTFKLPKQGNDHVFFKNGPPTNNTTTIKKKPGKLNEQFAKELRSICVSVNRIQPHNPIKWAHEFRKMREMDGKTPQQIQVMLDWYAVAVHDKSLKLPTIVNAGHFRKHFHWLHDLMTKQAKNEIEITPEVNNFIADLVCMHHPPKGCSWQEVRVMAQHVLNAARRFRTALLEVQKQPAMDGRSSSVLRMVDAILSHECLPNAVWFARTWTEEVLLEVANWTNWSGNLQSMTWTGDLTNKRFLKYVGETIKTWGGWKTWEHLKEVLS